MTTMHVPPAPAATLLTAARDRCEPELRRAVATLPAPLRLMSSYHFGWCDPSGAPVRGNAGKYLRPALTYAAARSCGAPAESATPIATALELIHNFTLIHDDIVDADPTRHGRETVWRIWGIPNALLLGDTLHALAIQILGADLPTAVSAPAITRLASAVIEVCQGQFEDCALESTPRAGLTDYEHMAMGKTGALIGTACALGALAAGAPLSELEALDRFGRDLGLAFQYTDDLLGIWGNPARTGKPVGNDLARRKFTLPVAIALTARTPAAVELATYYNSDATPTPADLTYLKLLIEACGGKTGAERATHRRTRTALQALPTHPATTDLRTLAQAMTHRDH
ncbi:polyprenyl synthetase family protein [Nocardia yamanashiensis]|uniref:polyprenyl synthetase family protein n=1 Tax=Nocardia yamanashiensis TaxID=209247 RepID=UPI000832ECD0|nr:polyprenyl synthetase family protein [Nocardia yamanashiensis]